METKQLSTIQKVFGDAYSGNQQKRYKHKKQFDFLREGNCICSITFENKISKKDLHKELSLIKRQVNADKIILAWTPMTGYIQEEVVL